MRHINRILYPEKVDKKYMEGKWKISMKGELTKTQRNTLINWMEEILINKDMNLPTLKNKLYFLRRLGIYLKKDWKKVTENDLKTFLKYMEQEGSSESSLFVYRVFIRQFFQWLYGLKEKEFPKCVDWIKIKRSNKKKLPEDIISGKDFKKMLKFCDQRDKTILMILKDTGCRIGEIIGLKLKEITFDTLGAEIKVDGKTGERKIRLIDSYPDLKLWFENHPYNDDENAPLFFQYSTNRYGHPLQWSGFSGVLKKVCKRAGINRKIHAHLFRHTDCTEKAQFMTDAEMRIHYGWSNGSPMPSAYTHLTDDDVNKSLIMKLAREGKIDVSKPEIKALLDNFKITSIAPQSINCNRCKEVNPPLTKICGKCGLIFDEKLAMKKQVDESKELNLVKTNMKNMEITLTKILEGMKTKTEYSDTELKQIEELSQQGQEIEQDEQFRNEMMKE